MQKIIKFSLLVLLVSNVNATMMPRKNNNSNSNQVLNEWEVKQILKNGDLATFKKIAWEKVYKIKDEILNEACAHSTTEIVLYLIKEGANINNKGGNWNNTPLHRAITMHKPKVARLLIQGGANVNLKTKSGETPLYYVLETGDVSLAKLLIDAGADIDSKDNNNRNVIEYGLWQSEMYKFKMYRKNILKVVSFIESVKEHRDRVNAWLNDPKNLGELSI